MRDCFGNLFSLFESNVSISNAEIVNVTTTQILMYLWHSRGDISNAVISNSSFTDAGRFATVMGQSALRFHSVTLRDMTSSEHGVISLEQSSMSLTACTLTGFNMSLITAQESTIAVTDSEVRNIWISFEGKTLSMLPNGGFVSCTDCSLIYISNTRFSDISANEGGVIYAQTTSGKDIAEVVLAESKFEKCIGKTYGGVLKATACKVTISGCNFEDNKAHMGGVVDFSSATSALQLINSSFVRNSAELDGSCIRWAGKYPQIANNSYTNNSALYGNPQASTPHHFVLLQSNSLLPVTQFPIIGVTGQKMEEPIVVGILDALEQLIVTDNSTVVTISFPGELVGSGNHEMPATQGVASLSLYFSPFSNSTFNFTLYSAKTDIANLTFQYRFHDCQPGEIRTTTGCSPCPKNSYSFDPSDASCTLCLAHAQCYGRTEVYLDVDYWRPNNMTDDIYPCLVRDACMGGMNSDCAEGYTSTLCGGCEDGYYKYGMWECRRCGGEIHQIGRGFIITALVLSAVSVPSQLFLRKEGLMYKLALLTRVFSNYAHTFLFVVLLHVRWPFTTLVHHEIWRAIGSLGQLLVYSGCQYTDLGINDYFFQVIAAAFYPLLLIVASVVFWCAAEIKLKYGLKQLFTVILACGLVAIYNFLPALGLMVISMYQCTEIAEHIWLVADTSQECWTGSHLSYILTITIPLLCFIAAISILFIRCIKHQSSLTVFQYIHQYMTAGYKENCIHWEIRVMLRKLVLLCLSLAYPKLDEFSHIMLFVCVIGIGVHIDIKRTPYISNWLNCTNVLADASIVVIAFTSVNGTEAEQTALAAFCSFAVVGAGCAALCGKVAEGEKQYALVDIQSPHTFQPEQGLSSSLEVSEGNNLRPPPSTPAEIDPKDIKLIESSF